MTLSIARERWVDLWPGIEPMLRANHEEAGTSAWRPWRPDGDALIAAEASGILGVWVARLRPQTSEGADPAGSFGSLDAPTTANLPARLAVGNAKNHGELCGCILWALQGDVESRGLIVAQQLAWYASPAAPTRTAMRLFIESVAELRQRGVAGILAHERFEGRGRHIGRWLRRMGAEPFATVYAMGIQDSVGT